MNADRGDAPVFVKTGASLADDDLSLPPSLLLPAPAPATDAPGSNTVQVQITDEVLARGGLPGRILPQTAWQAAPRRSCSDRPQRDFIEQDAPNRAFCREDLLLPRRVRPNVFARHAGERIAQIGSRRGGDGFEALYDQRVFIGDVLRFAGISLQVEQ